MPRGEKLLSFNETVSAAIADMSRYGYSSQARVDRWVKAIKDAAQREMVSTEKLQQELKRALGAIYYSQVDKGGLLTMNPGVSRFTLKNVKPKLRAELDRRIMAAANLIKLNRTTAINDTLQRFQGWATSIPLGGSMATDKSDARENVRKALKQLPFEERRVVIDQGHKFNASINSILADNAGAIALTWRSNWRQANYDYRPDHKERDKKVYLIRGSWAEEKGLVKPNKDGYYDQITAVAEEPFCRCFAEYIYSLEDLPEDMLTKLGKVTLEQMLDSDAA